MVSYLIQLVFRALKACFQQHCFTVAAFYIQICKQKQLESKIVLQFRKVFLDVQTHLCYCFFHLLLLESVDISLMSPWRSIQKINAHYKIIYLNIHSLLPKIDELFLIGKFIKTDITGISGVKLYDLFLQPKIQIDNYMFWWDKDCSSD